MNFIKSNFRMTNLVIFGMATLCLLLPFYSVGVSVFGVTSRESATLFAWMKNASVLALLGFAAPIGGLVYLFGFSGKRSQADNARLLAILSAAGLVMLFVLSWLLKGSLTSGLGMFSGMAKVGFGLGAWLSLLLFGAGVAVNGMMMGNKQ